LTSRSLLPCDTYILTKFIGQPSTRTARNALEEQTGRTHAVLVVKHLGNSKGRHAGECTRARAYVPSKVPQARTRSFVPSFVYPTIHLHSIYSVSRWPPRLLPERARDNSSETPSTHVYPYPTHLPAYRPNGIYLLTSGCPSVSALDLAYLPQPTYPGTYRSFGASCIPCCAVPCRVSPE